MTSPVERLEAWCNKEEKVRVYHKWENDQAAN